MLSTHHALAPVEVTLCNAFGSVCLQGSFQLLSAPCSSIRKYPYISKYQSAYLSKWGSSVQVLQSLRIEEYVAVPSQQAAFGRARVFKLRLQFFPEHLYPKEAGITFADVAHVFKTVFMLKLQVCHCLLLCSLKTLQCCVCTFELTTDEMCGILAAILLSM